MTRKSFYRIDPPADAIMAFDGEFAFLSNFYAHDMEVDGVVYSTVEHAFQALKTDDAVERDRVREAASPYLAKRRGRMVSLRNGWNEERFDVMETVLRIKFSDPDLAAKLLATGDRTLMEGNSWRDTTWGCIRNKEGEWRGQNRLGLALMKIREELRSQSKQ